MGLFNNLFKKPKKSAEVANYFEMLDGYTPVFSTYEGGVYEMELTRACIHAFASHCMKLQANIEGADVNGIKRILTIKPNQFMTSSQFLYKVATILAVTNTCYIVPVLDKFDKIIGYYPINPMMTEIVEVNGIPYLRYTFKNGQKAAIEFDMVGCLYNFNYSSDVRGDSNRCLLPTMKLIDTQNQGIEQGIKNSASFRFMANVNNFTKSEDLKKERKRFTEDNFKAEDGGLLLFPNTYTNIQQIRSDANIVDSDQMKAIETRVFDYFGCNESILQNKCVGDEWSAYYEGKIEPFSIQLSEALTCMTYSAQELSRGNRIVYSANRMQYMTNKDKLEVSSQMFDRGIMTVNQIMDIWSLPHVIDGDIRYIRKEYTEVSNLDDASKDDTSKVDKPVDKPVDNDDTGKGEEDA